MIAALQVVAVAEHCDEMLVADGAGSGGARVSDALSVLATLTWWWSTRRRTGSGTTCSGRPCTRRFHRVGAANCIAASPSN